MANFGLSLLFTSAAFLTFLVGMTFVFIALVTAFVERRVYAGIVTLLASLMAIGFSIWLWAL